MSLATREMRTATGRRRRTPAPVAIVRRRGAMSAGEDVEGGSPGALPMGTRTGRPLRRAAWGSLKN